jgi:hypothetical protein
METALILGTTQIPQSIASQPKPLSHPEALPEIKWADSKVDDIEKKISNKKMAWCVSEFDKALNLDAIIGYITHHSNEKGKKGYTILHIAIERGDLATVKLIMILSPELLNQSTDEGISPLCLAALLGKREMIDWLADPASYGLKEKVDVNKPTTTGDTPLHKAIFAGHHLVAKKLLEKGADVNALNKLGLTPADLARLRFGSIDIKSGHQVAQVVLEAQKYEELMAEFKPKRGILPLDQIREKFNNN